MAGIADWFTRQAPDVAATFRRFPLAVALLAIGTVLLIALLNEWFVDGDDLFGRLMVGVLAGSFYAVAGALLNESRKIPAWLNILVGWAVPIAVALSLQVENTTWIVALMLPPVGLFWMSVSAFTVIGSGAERAEQQDRFWWLNHRAVTTGIVAGLGFILVALGLFAIDRSLSFLFGLELGDIVYKFILPVAGVFLTPLYWMSTLPRLDEFSRSEIDEPDFLSRAIGFMGQFVLSPLLVIYSLILIAYAVQIVLVGELPEGILGWMVLVFIITGAANWLVLHPGFMHTRPTVRWFRRLWFWLTIVPIGLYAVAVWIRIDAYGLTEERILLIAGGLWAALLTLAYLSRLAADIRIIPGLAGLLLLLIAIGPWNLFNLARSDQLSRLDSALMAAQTDSGFEWTDESAQQARGTIGYLTSENENREQLQTLLERYGVVEDWEQGISPRAVYDALGIPELTTPDGETFTYMSWNRGAEPGMVTGMAVIYPPFQIHAQSETEMANLNFSLSGLDLVVSTTVTDPAATAEAATIVPLQEWIDSQLGEQIRNPVIGFTRGGVSYRLIVSAASVSRASEDAALSLNFIEGSLAASNAE